MVGIHTWSDGCDCEEDRKVMGSCGEMIHIQSHIHPIQVQTHTYTYIHTNIYILTSIHTHTHKQHVYSRTHPYTHPYVRTYLLMGMAGRRLCLSKGRRGGGELVGGVGEQSIECGKTCLKGITGMVG